MRVSPPGHGRLLLICEKTDRFELIQKIRKSQHSLSDSMDEPGIVRNYEQSREGETQA